MVCVSVCVCVSHIYIYIYVSLYVGCVVGGLGASRTKVSEMPFLPPACHASTAKRPTMFGMLLAGSSGCGTLTKPFTLNPEP